MQIALAIQPDHKSIGDLKPHLLFSVESTVKDICGLFVRVIDSKVYLIHQSAKEFLIKRPTTTIPAESSTWKQSLCPIESSLTLAKSCTYYLLFAVFETDPLVPASSGNKTKIDRYAEEHVFLDYAAKHWATHTLEAKMWEGDEFSPSALEVLNGPARLLTWFLVYKTAVSGCSCNPKNATRLAVASYIGLDRAVELLIEKGDDVNGRHDLYDSALNAAAWREHSSIVKLLLNRGAIVYLFGREYRDILKVNSYLWRSMTESTANHYPVLHFRQ